MSRSTRWLFGLSMLVATALTFPADAQQTDADPASLWADFNHYTLIARPDLADAAGKALLSQVDNAQLLDIVEASDYTDYDATLLRGQRIESLQATASDLEQRIQAARIERSRDEARIAADIEALDKGQRPYRNAVQRLASAGQFAAPQLLATLEDDSKSRLHPYVTEAVVAIGQPLVYPLSVALPNLEPATQNQVAQVLAEIGYPQPLPYLKEILESSDLAPANRQVLTAAYNKLASGTNIATTDAATLFLLLGQQQYRMATRGDELPGYDASQEKGMVWVYSDTVGLVPVPVPGPIFGDVLAMKASGQSLKLNPDLDAALSLWITANLRRENNLPAGEDDPSYPAEMQSPMYYAMLSGPVRLHDVLAQALADEDSQLALDAIAALADTAGTNALVRRDAATKPLLEALSYPDRRVRFNAALALANARPTSDFDSAFRVIPVLSEAVRQDETLYAAVLADDQETLNSLNAAMSDLGYEVIGGLSLDVIQSQLQSSPGVNLLVVAAPANEIESTYTSTINDYQLGAVPILALAPTESEVRISDWAEDKRRVAATSRTTDPQELQTAVDKATASYAGDSIDAEQATAFALAALATLREVALDSDVYRVVDAQPALIAALGDERFELVEASANVLSLIDTAEAQQAIANAAFAATGDDQVILLDALSESATYFGNKLNDSQVAELATLVDESTGPNADAAARAHGALALPTADAVKQILK